MALITLGANSGKGKILQVVRNYVATQGTSISTTSSSYTGSGIQASITPTASGNLILVDFVSSMVYASDQGRAKMYQKIGSGSFASTVSNSDYQIGHINSSLAQYYPHVLNMSYTATSTDTLTYEPYILSSSGRLDFVHANSSYALTLTEVEQ